jgi:hypothetical protein
MIFSAEFREVFAAVSKAERKSARERISGHAPEDGRRDARPQNFSSARLL